MHDRRLFYGLLKSLRQLVVSVVTMRKDVKYVYVCLGDFGKSPRILTR